VLRASRPALGSTRAAATFARLGCFALLLAVTGVCSAEVWVLIDTAGHRLAVYRNHSPLLSIRNIAIGSGGAAATRVEGDATTPLGEFRVSRINRESRFHVFLGLDYPTLAHAKRAHTAGLIDTDTYFNFEHLLAMTGAPPQNTPLGGNIGIHGIGQGDPDIHRQYDWTRGCVAVTNEQIEQLTRLVRVGTRVLIR
jgi:murein L,D-transpeptidase YafK